jgi:multiple sugar transport system permease protein
MKTARAVTSYMVLILLAILLFAPFVWMVFVSLHEPNSTIPTVDKLVPDKAHWENYTFVLFHPNLPISRFFVNTVFVTVSVVILQLLITSLAGYAFARIPFRGRSIAFALFLGAMMFAGPVTQIPVFLMLKGAGWLDTFKALIIPGISSSYAIFLLKSFFEQIPKELDEAARLDGATELTVYWKIVMPLSRAALATAGAFAFFATWTDFFNPMIYTNSTQMRTLEVGLSIFKNSYQQTDWPHQMAAAVIVLIPLLVVFVFTQRYFTKGVIIGSFR